MALRALMAKKKLEEKKKELENQRAVMADFLVREADLEKAIEEASTDEEKATVEEEIGKYETEKAEAEEKEKALADEVETLEKELADVEAEQEKEPEPKEVPAEEKREDKIIMEKRNLFAGMDVEQRTAIFENDGMKNWLGELRSAIKEKRAITNVGLTIPEIILPILRQNILEYSKLYKHVRVRTVSGTARQNIMSEFPEAIWTECCANLNELALGFNDWSFDCYKVAGYFALCNANIEDSDLDLASEVLLALGQAIGKAVDKAILFGKNTNTNSKMPLGVASRIAQTSQPADYPTTARTWVDLHSTHVVSIGTELSPVTGVNLFKEIMKSKSVTYNLYNRDEIVWVMNDKTYNDLKAESMSINAAGAIVAGFDGTMPVIGGAVEVLNFIPDGVVIAGYFELYTLVERASREFASSEHVRFLQDQIVYKGTARYDGAPVIAEAFMVLQINGGSLDVTAIQFPQDTANPTSI